MKTINKLFLIVNFLITPLAVFCQSDTTITVFDEVHQGFGGDLNRTETDTFIFPSSVTGYDSILMHVTLKCPTGGCDPWDRLAYIQLIKNKYVYEIGRYVTPYGKGCGWTLDVSDYKSMLTDTVIISSFIDTWVNPAWLVTIQFEFKAGVPQYEYTSIDNLWGNYYVAYGDTSKPIDISEITKNIPSGTEKVKLKIINTGHGQGNTDNAAEFSQKTHTIFIDGDSTFSHYLWRNNCSSNPCSPQSGTWQYNRAGWCPGANVEPKEYDLASLFTAGQSIKVKYGFEDYLNECSPNYGGCVEGVTCSDCDYNYNGHTEPYYAFVGQFIYYSNSVLEIPERTNNPEISIYPNPSNGLINIESNKIKEISDIVIYDLQGRIVYQSKIIFSKHNKSKINFSNINPGIYFIQLKNEKINMIEKIVKQ